MEESTSLGKIDSEMEKIIDAQNTNAETGGTNSTVEDGEKEFTAPNASGCENVKKSKSTKDKNREKRNDEKCLKDIIKNLPGDEKCKKLYNKCLDLIQERRALEEMYKNKFYSQTVKTVQMENLCRELHKEYKRMKNENEVILRGQESKTKEISDKFKLTINDVNISMQDMVNTNEQLRQTNGELVERLRQVCEETTSREKTYAENTAKLQTELVKTQQLLCQSEKRYQKQMKRLNWLEKQYEKQREESKTIHEKLVNDVNNYKCDYENVQSTLSSNSALYSGLQDEVTKMKTKFLDVSKELDIWRTKFELQYQITSKLNEKIGQHEANLATKNKQLEKMKDLNRALQKDRVECYEENKKLRDLLNLRSTPDDLNKAANSLNETAENLNSDLVESGEDKLSEEKPSEQTGVNNGSNQPQPNSTTSGKEMEYLALKQKLLELQKELQFVQQCQTSNPLPDTDSNQS